MTSSVSAAAEVQRRTMATLVAGQIVGATGITIGIATASLLAEELSGSEKLAGLAQTSQVGFVVREEALPVAAGLVEMVGTEKAREIVMSAGGDFELVFTVRPGELDAARRACALTVIGEVVEEEGIWIEQAGHRLRIEPRGYEHRIGGMD